MLVTGGAGFLGRALVAQLLSLGSCRVRVLALPPPRSIPRGLAYLAAHASEPVFRRFLMRQRPPVTCEALNLIAWDSCLPADKARALGWAPRVDYATVMQGIRDGAP